jgi:alpha-ribazole phosphatase
MGTYCHLYLVRHGLTAWNAEKRYIGHTDHGILREKREQLSSLKEALQQLQFQRIYSSDLKRCLETLDYVYPTKDFLRDERLREMNFGEWEGKTYDFLKGDPHYRKWVDDGEHHTPPAGESASSFKGRIDSFINQLLKEMTEETDDKETDDENSDSSTILIVTHGGVIRHFLTRFMPSSSFWEWKVIHGTGLHVTLENAEGEWRCSSWSVVPTPEKEE